MKMKQMCNYKKAGMMMLAQLVSLGAFAFDAEVNGIYYNLNAKTKEACVTTGDEWSEEYVAYAGDIVIPSSITYNGKTYSVTSIENGTFAHCINITSVTIPNSVKVIGSSAFSDCSGLTSITIPNSVTSINDETFRGCI